MLLIKVNQYQDLKLSAFVIIDIIYSSFHISNMKYVTMLLIICLLIICNITIARGCYFHNTNEHRITDRSIIAWYKYYTRGSHFANYTQECYDLTNISIMY